MTSLDSVQSCGSRDYSDEESTRFDEKNVDRYVLEVTFNDLYSTLEMPAGTSIPQLLCTDKESVFHLWNRNFCETLDIVL